jgi:radical SAM protein with 4Fe4S-binding SPASM domain
MAGMRFRSLSLVITDDCNFDCSYCYKTKGEAYMPLGTAEKAVAFLLPYCDDESYLIFYGGEPLLAFDLIKDVVSFAERKSRSHHKTVRYSLTTNGVLLSEAMVEFFALHEFLVVLSFDGLAQEVHRQKGTLPKMQSVVERLKLHPRIRLEVNSVFTPVSVYRMADSIRHLIDLGIPKIRYSLSVKSPWNEVSLRRLESELGFLVEILAEEHARTDRVPVENLTQRLRGPGVFRCSGSKDRLALTPEGQVWGCDLFAEHFKRVENPSILKDYHFGNIDDFIDRHAVIYPEKAPLYGQLRTDNFYTASTECFICEYLPECGICPMEAAFSGLPLGEVPSYLCRIQRIKSESRKRFQSLVRDQP